LAAISPSCSKEDKISSSRLQGSQLPPEDSGIADSVSDDLAEFPAASDVAAWWDVSGSMAARGVAEMTSRTSRDEEDEASLCRKQVKWPASRNSEQWLTGDRGALTVALRRENAQGGMRCEMAGGDRPGYI
jgi:hypothetical protein